MFFLEKVAIMQRLNSGTPISIKANANGLNIVGQQHPALLGPTMLWLVASVCMEPQQCWHLLRIVWNQSNFQGPCERTQQEPTTPNIVGCCWPTMLCPFAWALTIRQGSSKRRTTYRRRQKGERTYPLEKTLLKIPLGPFGLLMN